MKRIEGVTERLLAAAREEFLEKGYEAASLRAIAERAGSSKGAIYVRYADKEALYAAVVDPVIEELCLFFTEEFDGFGKLPADVQQSTMNDYADQGIGLMMDYIYDHLAEFKILVTNGGERYDEFMHRVVELNSATTYRYIEAVGSDAVTAGRLTPELMHMISSACFSGIFEAVAHDMGRDEAKAYVERLCLFFRAGWQAIFDPQFAALVDLAAQMPDAPVQDVAARLVEARDEVPRRRRRLGSLPGVRRQDEDEGACRHAPGPVPPVLPEMPSRNGGGSAAGGGGASIGRAYNDIERHRTTRAEPDAFDAEPHRRDFRKEPAVRLFSCARPASKRRRRPHDG